MGIMYKLCKNIKFAICSFKCFKYAGLCACSYVMYKLFFN